MPQPELLETFPNPYADRDYEIFMTTPEFTSLCPLGGIETDAAELAVRQRIWARALRLACRGIVSGLTSSTGHNGARGRWH